MAIFWELFDQNYVVKSLILLARSEGFEPPTLGIENILVRCYINGLGVRCCVRVAVSSQAA